MLLSFGISYEFLSRSSVCAGVIKFFELVVILSANLFSIQSTVAFAVFLNVLMEAVLNTSADDFLARSRCF